LRPEIVEDSIPASFPWVKSPKKNPKHPAMVRFLYQTKNCLKECREYQESKTCFPTKNLLNTEKCPTIFEASTGCETMPFPTRISPPKKTTSFQPTTFSPGTPSVTHTFAALHKAAAPSQAAAAPSDAPPAAAAPWFFGVYDDRFGAHVARVFFHMEPMFF